MVKRQLGKSASRLGWRAIPYTQYPTPADGWEPGYLALHRSGELAERARGALRIGQDEAGETVVEEHRGCGGHGLAAVALDLEFFAEIAVRVMPSAAGRRDHDSP